MAEGSLSERLGRGRGLLLGEAWRGGSVRPPRPRTGKDSTCLSPPGTGPAQAGSRGCCPRESAPQTGPTPCPAAVTAQGSQLREIHL